MYNTFTHILQSMITVCCRVLFGVCLDAIFRIEDSVLYEWESYLCHVHTRKGGGGDVGFSRRGSTGKHENQCWFYVQLLLVVYSLICDCSCVRCVDWSLLEWIEPARLKPWQRQTGRARVWRQYMHWLNGKMMRSLNIVSSCSWLSQLSLFCKWIPLPLRGHSALSDCSNCHQVLKPLH